jgi:serine/threonine protein kinase
MDRISSSGESHLADAHRDALPRGYALRWYVVDGVLGQGGFGVTYLGRDTNLDRPVAIKECLPAGVATHCADGTVAPRTGAQHGHFRRGLDAFVAEARMLARFDHPNIVRVHAAFELNGTAYIVMRLEEGTSLAAVLELRGTLPEDELIGFLLPVLDALELVHEAGVIHRDLKPDNFYVRRDGSPVVLDFGSARCRFRTPGPLTSLVAPGYAPLEQYCCGADDQGPWTDLYGLAATCYRAVAGRPPVDAITRGKGILGGTRELLEPVAAFARGRYSERLMRAIDHALAFSAKDRPQSVGEWRREILGAPA